MAPVEQFRDVSVVIPVRADDRIFACLASIDAIRGEVPGALQVLIVDNDSPPAFRARLRAELPAEVTLLTEDGSIGAYAARNRAVEVATGDAIFFTDADCLVRPGWFAAGLAQLVAGAGIVQGFAGGLGAGPLAQIMQDRHEAHTWPVPEGAPTQVDTKNCAVARRVFDTERFNERFRRAADTEFGLVAELHGHRVAFAPKMAVDHANDLDIPLFLAKQVCHGWGSRRIEVTYPGIAWNGGHPRLVKVVVAVARVCPFRRAAGAALARGLIGAGALAQRVITRVPRRGAFWLLTALDKLAAVAGYFLYEGGAPEPSPSELLGRRLLRD
ncbi:MAG: glycosyltransferase family 2 protein [Dehalococcoidia bacterium]